MKCESKKLTFNTYSKKLSIHMQQIQKYIDLIEEILKSYKILVGIMLR